MLETRGLTRRFGGLVAVQGIDFVLPRGAIASVIGPNGAGKTTFFNLLVGIYPASAGTIALDGQVLPALAPHQMVRRGVARTFQNIRLFPSSALENVLVGCDTRAASSVWRFSRTDERDLHDRARELLDFVGLERDSARPARDLPYGHQRLLEIARALGSEPRVLLLDEPAAGMNPTETAALIDLIRRIRDRGVTVLLIEHDIRLVMEISDQVTVFDHGQKIGEGTPAEVAADPRVIEAYLGC